MCTAGPLQLSFLSTPTKPRTVDIKEGGLLKLLQMTCSPAFCIALPECLHHWLLKLRTSFICHQDQHQVICAKTMKRVPITGNKITYQIIWKVVLKTNAEWFGVITWLQGLPFEEMDGLVILGGVQSFSSVCS